LEHLVKRYPQAKKTTLRGMVEHKRVVINGAVVRSVKQAVGEGDRVEILDVPAVADGTALAQGLKIVYFDADIVVVDKPAGLLTATDAQEKRATVLAIWTAYFQRKNTKSQVHLVHRLDRDASGLLIFARNWKAFAGLKR